MIVDVHFLERRLSQNALKLDIYKVKNAHYFGRNETIYTYEGNFLNRDG